MTLLNLLSFFSECFHFFVFLISDYLTPKVHDDKYIDTKKSLQYRPSCLCYPYYASSDTYEDGVLYNKVERLNGNPYLKTVKTSTVHEYDICVQIVLIYKDTEWEGVTQLGIHDKQTDGYLRVGVAFDY